MVNYIYSLFWFLEYELNGNIKKAKLDMSE